MREIVFDTETTGLDPKAGHRLVEVGCIELVNHLPTGRRFQRYINPGRDMPAEAMAVHGLTAEFLAKFPGFEAAAEPLLEFFGDSPLVIHNADFDMNFLNSELKTIGLAPVPRERAIDTLAIARRRFPGSPASLDALCKRFNVDASARTVHGALLDAELLAEVYIELIGAREPGLELAITVPGGQAPAPGAAPVVRHPVPHTPTEQELADHRAFVAKLPKAIWLAGG
jgi:DNA polymerase-3 subunit epsilon